MLEAKCRITEADFRAATPEQVLVDADGRQWKILENTSEKRGRPTLRVQCPGHEPEEVSLEDGWVVETEKEEARFLEFNHEKATIV
jgi:hypothetical protein